MSKRARLSEDEIQRRLSELEGWTLEAGALVRRWAWKDFGEAFGFLARVALLAERHDHHPELHNVWNRVELRLTTHDAGGLTGLDFALAGAINEVAR
jgi:4a-hydroxytetrahydrobiopterin dehydratase